ncbi:MAG TPA: cyclopropane-fatty-acyl-phospholipid synthase family protein [Hyphomicrobiaceae bacterium]|nr:cyclopropane-fatty-acyl-phospholipid synthase family protein [Hyphomicrobiaceae bacterium]
MFKPLALLARRIVRCGNLTLITADGARHSFGDGTGGPVVARLADKRVERQLALDPQLAVGEAYMDGRLVMEEGSIYDLLAVVLQNMMERPLPRWAHGLDLARFMTRRIAQFNPARRSRRNVAHHYDIDGTIYDLFLDSDRQYSCAYFSDRATDLEEAQLLKKRHLAAKLDLRQGHRVLDIGSGWGGLGLYLAKTSGCSVDGITLSAEQLKLAEQRAQRHGLASAVRFELRDYRHVEGQYDRIVSVGMFEHVGVNHYATFFRKVRDLLAEDGVALLHFIGRSDRPTITNPFIAKYIFPGGYIPALSEVMPAIERSGLIATDIEVLRLHYAETLRHWRERFRANWAEAARIRDERFCRMWEFYLAGSECAFRYQNLVVFQIQLTRRVDALPWVRDYMADAEFRLAGAERGLRHTEPPRMAGE